MADRYWIAGAGNWNSTANWSATSGGAGGASIPGVNDNVFFDRAASYVVTVPDSYSANCINLTASNGTVQIQIDTTTTGATLTIRGNVDFTGSASGSRIYSNNSAGLLNFGALSDGLSGTITSAGRVLSAATVTFNHSITLLDALTTNSITVCEAGTLTLNNYNLTCSTFSADSTRTRTIDFGTGSITCIGSGTAFSIAGAATATTLVGTPRVILAYSGGTAMTVQCKNMPSSPYVSFYFTAGGYALTFLGSGSNYTVAQNVDFTGSSCSWTLGTSQSTIYGNLTLSSTMTSVASTQALTFGATSGTQTITSSGRTINFPITINGVGGTVRMADALTLGTKALTLTNGTFDGGGFTISGASAFTISTGSMIIQNINTALAFTHTSGTMTLGGNCTFGAFTFTAGSLVL